MLNQDYTAKVLNLEDVIITNVENISDVLHICLELPRQKHRCPACGALTDRIHDYRMQTIKDIPMGRETLLHLRKRRYRCSCGKRFFEKNSFLPRYYRITSRLVAAIITAFRDTVSSARIGTQYHVSGTTAMRYFKCVGFRPTELPEVLSLDEFKGNSGGQKYNSIALLAVSASPGNSTEKRRQRRFLRSLRSTVFYDRVDNPLDEPQLTFIEGIKLNIDPLLCGFIGSHVGIKVFVHGDTEHGYHLVKGV